MKKRFLIALCMFIFIFVSTTQSFAGISGYTTPKKAIKLRAYSKAVNLKLPVLYKNGVTLYPFKEVMEKVGAKVSYDSKTKAAVATLNGKSVGFPIKSSTYYVNGVAKKMTGATTLVDSANNTYIPVRYAMEGLGLDVMYIKYNKYDEIRISNLGEYSQLSENDFLDAVRFRKEGISGKTTDPDYERKTSLFNMLLQDCFTYKAGDKKINFYDSYYTTNGKPTPVTLSQKLNPNIYSQIKNLYKVLMAKDYEVYTSIGSRDKLDFTKNTVFVDWGLGTTNVVNYPYLGFMFNDNVPINEKGFTSNSKSSTKAFLKLDILTLSNTNDLDTIGWSSPFFEKKLRDSMIVLFGNKTGVDIYKYLLTKYLQQRNDYLMKDVTLFDTKSFDNIRVDYSHSGISAVMSFYFSYIK
jgi:hypothetical protein